MSNTIWNEWYYTDRFFNKPYPFVDNVCKSKIDESKKRSKPKQTKSKNRA